MRLFTEESQRDRPSSPLAGNPERRVWESLTPTETKVVEFATEGLTNPQIGERMLISRATVKVHLAHVYKKLAVSNRTELAAQAARRER